MVIQKWMAILPIVFCPATDLVRTLVAAATGETRVRGWCAVPLRRHSDADHQGHAPPGQDPQPSGTKLPLLLTFPEAGQDKAQVQGVSYPDVNADGIVDPLDVGYILARFGTCE